LLTGALRAAGAFLTGLTAGTATAAEGAGGSASMLSALRFEKAMATASTTRAAAAIA